jgi:LmbE family N-acetylglucosaminyl deacetylase
MIQGSPFPAKALVVAAHPDDEALGCGGTMAALAAAGCAVKVAFVADGVGARGTAMAGLEERRGAAYEACARLGAEIVHVGSFPDNRLDTVALLDIVRMVEGVVAQHRPQLVLTHHPGDLNVDHRQVAAAVLTACRPVAGHPVSTLLSFEVCSSTEWNHPDAQPGFSPDLFVDISATLGAKLDALRSYGAEMRPWPHPRSFEAVEHLARWRGAVVGAQAAEAFKVLRMVVRP